MSNLSWLESPVTSPKAVRTSIGPNTAKKAGRGEEKEDFFALLVSGLHSVVWDCIAHRLTKLPPIHSFARHGGEPAVAAPLVSVILESRPRHKHALVLVVVDRCAAAALQGRGHGPLAPSPRQLSFHFVKKPSSSLPRSERFEETHDDTQTDGRFS